LIHRAVMPRFLVWESPHRHVNSSALTNDGSSQSSVSSDRMSPFNYSLQNAAGWTFAPWTKGIVVFLRRARIAMMANATLFCQCMLGGMLSRPHADRDCG